MCYRRFINYEAFYAIVVLQTIMPKDGGKALFTEALRYLEDICYVSNWLIGSFSRKMWTSLKT